MLLDLWDVLKVLLTYTGRRVRRQAGAKGKNKLNLQIERKIKGTEEADSPNQVEAGTRETGRSDV